MEKIRFLTISIMTILIVFGITSQIMVNIASAQESRSGESCSTQNFAGDILTICSVGGFGAGGGGEHREVTICDPSGNCVSNSISGGSGTGGRGDHYTSGYTCSETEGCSFSGGSFSGGHGVGGGSHDWPHQGFSSGGVAPQQGFSSGGVAPQQGFSSGGVAPQQGFSSGGVAPQQGFSSTQIPQQGGPSGGNPLP